MEPRLWAYLRPALYPGVPSSICSCLSHLSTCWGLLPLPPVLHAFVFSSDRHSTSGHSHNQLPPSFTLSQLLPPSAPSSESTTLYVEMADLKVLVLVSQSPLYKEGQRWQASQPVGYGSSRCVLAAVTDGQCSSFLVRPTCGLKLPPPHNLKDIYIHVKGKIVTLFNTKLWTVIALGENQNSR